MQRVFKYTIPREDYFSLNLPKGAKILTVQKQHGEPQLWALVEQNNVDEERNFCNICTGHPIEKNIEALNYIGTFRLADDDYVFHLFEIK